MNDNAAMQTQGHRDGKLDCAWLISDPGSAPAQANMRITIAAGRIANLTPLDTAPPAPRRLVMPALANAHDHGRMVRTSSLGAFDRPLESWLPFQGLLPGVDPYLCAATSFARSVRKGVAHLMVHYTRVQGVSSYLEEAAAVAQAARDVGVHIGFAVALRDSQGLGYAPDATVLAALRPEIRDAVTQRLTVRALAPAQHVALVEEVARMVAADASGSLAPHVCVQYGPTGVQWCGTPLLEAIAQASADNNRPVHMHLLETKYQRVWADQAHPDGIVRYLDTLGLLTPRLTLAHCVWARPDELALLAERGVTIAVNTSSNLGLKSGIAPVADMLRQGCRIAMGLDGGALDDDDDALREMRLAYQLHRGWGFDVDMTRAQLWAFAARNGRSCVGGSAYAGNARIAVGEPADLQVLDLDALEGDDAFLDGVDPLDLLLARAHGAHINQVIVGGRTAERAGQLTGLDEAALRAELAARMRSALASQSDAVSRWRGSVQALAEDLGPFYRNSHFLGCC